MAKKQLFTALSLPIVLPIVLMLAVLWPRDTLAADKIFIYSASSMTGVLQALVKAIPPSKDVKWVPVFGASSTLSRQISQGAPAHVYISAHPRWMDDLELNNFLIADSRTIFARNELVLVTGNESAARIDLQDTEAFRFLIGNGRFAISDPAHVPAGMYAKQALQSTDLWPIVENRLAIASNARVALAYIARQEATMGVIYKSDLIGSQKLHQIASFPDGSYGPIHYTAALVRSTRTKNARRFMVFLQSDKARAILNQFGFIAP